MNNGIIVPADVDPVVSPRPRGITADQWANYAERVDILSTVMATILEMLATNPMVAPILGAEFVAAANDAGQRLIYLRDNVQ
jgi:hypothetical protein